MRLRCNNCQKINPIRNKSSNGAGNFLQKGASKKEINISQVCYWCKQHISARQSKKSQKEKKK